MSIYSQRLGVILAILFALSACASREVLQPLPPDNGAGVSFAGQWQLRGDHRLIEAKLRRAIRDTDGVRDTRPLARSRSPQAQRGDGRVKGGLVHVFFENGETLKISQTESAIFVSFDRAIVEEYRFGENRVIKVGQAEAQRVSGWAGRDYVIESLDRNGMKLTERYQVSEDRQSLTRSITFRSKAKESVTVIQLFSRV
ncbi:MAG: hypothetical protein HKP32_06775 [Woeseia sp.]|nr:hypothetical protein [Woeseia sp.]